MTLLRITRLLVLFLVAANDGLAIPPTVPGAGSTVDDAIARWTARTASQPDQALAWIQLGDALMQRSRDRGDPTLLARAQTAFTRARELDPREPHALVGLAWVANTRHEFEAGRRWAKEALAIDPRMPEPYALLGDAAVEVGDYDEALDHFQASLDLRPDLSSYARAAHVLWLTGDPMRAQILMRKAIAAGAPHAENTAWCRSELGLMMFEQGALLPAEQEVERALREAPDHPHILAARGRIRMARKDYPGAIDCYERAAAILPQPATLASLAELYLLQGSTGKAEAMLRRLRDSDHHHDHAAASPGAHVHRGNEEHDHPHTHPHSPSDDSGRVDSNAGGPAYHAHGNVELARFLADHDRELDRALAEAEEAYRTFKNVGVTDTLAWCYHKQGRDEDAQRLIRRALRWKTPSALLHFHAGMIHAGLGHRPAAQQHLAKALNLNPHFHPVHAEVATQTLAQLGSGQPIE